ncbi:MAG: helix-turn-helix transcriptional regulator [Myxococcales bacterium]|nr:helix-turn-helix transcriptional regulator [Myxococcales bacterium]
MSAKTATSASADVQKRTAGSAPGSASDGCCEVVFVDEERVGRVRDAMLPDELVQEVADIFKALSHPTRVRVLRALATEELCVCDLAQVLSLSISATSHQLRALRAMRLVRFRMDGKLAYYSLRDPFVRALLEDGVRHLTKPSEGAP